MFKSMQRSTNLNDSRVLFAKRKTDMIHKAAFKESLL